MTAIMFRDAGRLVVTNNWTVSCQDVDKVTHLSVTYFDQTHGPDANLAVVRIPFQEFIKRLHLAMEPPETPVDLLELR